MKTSEKIGALLLYPAWIGFLLGSVAFFITGDDPLRTPLSVRLSWVLPCYGVAIVSAVVSRSLLRRTSDADAAEGAIGAILVGSFWFFVLIPILPSWALAIIMFWR